MLTCISFKDSVRTAQQTLCLRLVLGRCLARISIGTVLILTEFGAVAIVLEEPKGIVPQMRPVLFPITFFKI